MGLIWAHMEGYRCVDMARSDLALVSRQTFQGIMVFVNKLKPIMDLYCLMDDFSMD